MARTRPVVVHEDACAVEHGAAGVTWRTLLSGDRTPTAGLTVGVACLEPGQRGRPHRHPPAEAYYVLAGEGVLCVDGEQHPVRAGSAAFLPGGAVHDLRNTGGDPLRLLYVFPTDAFADVAYDFLEAEA